MGAGDNIVGGLSRQDAVYAAREFERAGIHVLDESGGLCMFSIENKSPGFFDFLSNPIYEEVEIPVILTGELRLVLT